MDSVPETFSYYPADKPYLIKEIDSTINNIEEYNFLQQDGWEYVGIGNLGQAHYSLKFNPQTQGGFQSGLRYFDQFKSDFGTIKYYNVAKPLSEIRYSIGSNRQNVFGATHAQNIKNRLELGVNFDRIRSEGAFGLQQTRDASFDLYAHYHSKNNRYHALIEMAFSKIKVQENGGIALDILSDSASNIFSPQLLPTNLSQATTEHKNFDVLITNTYDIAGFHQIDSINDSLAVKRFYPTFSISHSIGTGKNTFAYTDFDPDQSFYNLFYQIDDSAYYRLYYHELPNKVSFRYTGAQNSDSVTYRNIDATAYIQHYNIEVWQNRIEHTYNNFQVGGRIMSNRLASKPLQYDVSSNYYFTGYNKNEFAFRSMVAYDLKKYGIVSASFNLLRLAPSYIENNFYSDSYNWDNNFDHKQYTQFSATYQMPKWNLKLTGEYQLLNNHIIFQNIGQSVQVDKTLHYWQFNVRKDLAYKIWHLDNFVGVQGISDPLLVRMPRLFLKSSFYVQGKIFKGNMLARVGFDIRYNTNFTAQAWNPLTNQFQLQNERNMKYVPILDVFINFKVNTLRVFIKGSYLNQGLFAKNYYTALNYPTEGRTFAGGLIWRFLE